MVVSTGRGASAGPGETPECPHCHRRHLGVCRLLTGGCFRCGSTKHFMANCPKESRDNRNPQSNSRGRFAAPPSTLDRGRGRWGQSQHRGRGGTLSETVDRLMPTAPTRACGGPRRLTRPNPKARPDPGRNFLFEYNSFFFCQ